MKKSKLSKKPVLTKHGLIPPALSLLSHVLIPPAPFSAVAKKGEQILDKISTNFTSQRRGFILLYYSTFPLFASAERGIKGVSTCHKAERGKPKCSEGKGESNLGWFILI